MQKLQHGTSEAQAEDIFDVIKLCDVEDVVTTLIFVTNASNSG